MGVHTARALRVRKHRAVFVATLAIVAVAIAGCAAPYTTDQVHSAFTALPGVEDARITSTKQLLNPTLHVGAAEVSPAILAHEYLDVLELTRDYPNIRWRAGTRLGEHPSFAVHLATDANPDHIPAVAAWTIGTANLDGILAAKASVRSDPGSDSTAWLEVELAGSPTVEAKPLVPLLRELDALTALMPYAHLSVLGRHPSIQLDSYNSLVVDALSEIESVSPVTAVKANYKAGEGGMLVTVANDASRDAAQQLAYENLSEWGSVTVQGPHDSFDVVPGDPVGAAKVDGARSLRALPGDFDVSVGTYSVDVRNITLEEVAVIDKYRASDPVYQHAPVTWDLKDAGPLTRLYKPVGQPFQIEPLVAASHIDGIDELRTTTLGFQPSIAKVDTSGARIEITATRSDLEALMQELRTSGISALTGMEFVLTARESQAGNASQVSATINAQGDLVDVSDPDHARIKNLVSAWNAAG